MNTFPARRRAMVALGSISLAGIAFYCVGFPMPAALVIAAILWFTLTRFVRI
jgi:hypothetical protein